jgi:prevent-host-death family protein
LSDRIGVRELRNDVSDILRRTEAGEEFVVTVRGRPVARVTSLEKAPTTMPKEVFFAALNKVAADGSMLHEIRAAAPGTTDEAYPWSD